MLMELSANHVDHNIAFPSVQDKAFQKISQNTASTESPSYEMTDVPPLELLGDVAEFAQSENHETSNPYDRLSMLLDEASKKASLDSLPNHEELEFLPLTRPFVYMSPNIKYVPLVSFIERCLLDDAIFCKCVDEVTKRIDQENEAYKISIQQTIFAQELSQNANFIQKYGIHIAPFSSYEMKVQLQNKIKYLEKQAEEEAAARLEFLRAKRTNKHKRSSGASQLEGAQTSQKKKRRKNEFVSDQEFDYDNSETYVTVQGEQGRYSLPHLPTSQYLSGASQSIRLLRSDPNLPGLLNGEENDNYDEEYEIKRSSDLAEAYATGGRSAVLRFLSDNPLERDLKHTKPSSKRVRINISSIKEAVGSGNNKQQKKKKRASRPKLIGTGPVDEAIYEKTFSTIWSKIVHKQIPRAHKIYVTVASIANGNARKIASVAAREVRRCYFARSRASTFHSLRFRRCMKEMLAFWKRNEKEERDSKKRAEREEAERKRLEEEAKEAKRQARKLNFLINQTELFSHFIAKKHPTDLDIAGEKPKASKISTMELLEDESSTEDALKDRARESALQALEMQRESTRSFDQASGRDSHRNQSIKKPSIPAISHNEDDFQHPSSMPGQLLEQPQMLHCSLKTYQLKGLAWLANLYEQGINGILADEMGLGKTVQSISLLTHLAETQGIWGPFLVVAPASTLHNWQQELTRFVPGLHTLPYWGSVNDRKTLRKFWTSKEMYTKNAPFHVLVTSYQILVADEVYFKKLKWQYMILDEAQALKSSSSIRWKTLLHFTCRNRLLLTGTPLQNSMAELWALLHFIMPSLFDSNAEFTEWFSKDIESASVNQLGFNEHQLRRLHLILKPFMLRRVKKDVENELGDKLEITLDCSLSSRQKRLYESVKKRLKSDEKLLRKLKSTNSSSSASIIDRLMNLVMQLRKICNHPELLMQTAIQSPFLLLEPGAVSYRDTSEVFINPKSPIQVYMPKLLRNIIPYHESFHSTFFSHTIQNGEFELLPSKASKLSFYIENLFKISERSDSYLENIPDLCFELISAISPLLHRETFHILPAVIAPSIFLEWTLTPPIQQSNSSILNGMLRPLFTRRRQTPSNLFSSPFVRLPKLAHLVTDSGKLTALDALLVTLKAGGHRCLVYFQMTRMMDLVEDYCHYRNHQYLRLDGSTKISDRRDLVHDWQHKPELFLFLLSTRAGGLGINLTAADTVIFYDSDWNPTVDQQAMDRAHRLGQTKQVSVYRLITKNSIEERILKRAAQKHEIHQVVIAGGAFQQEHLDREIAVDSGTRKTSVGMKQHNESTDPSSGPSARDMVALLLDEEDEEGYEMDDHPNGSTTYTACHHPS